MKYIVYLKDTSFGFVKLEADSQKEAEEKAMEELFNGNIKWGDSESEVVGIEEKEYVKI